MTRFLVSAPTAAEGFPRKLRGIARGFAPNIGGVIGLGAAMLLALMPSAVWAQSTGQNGPLSALNWLDLDAEQPATGAFPVTPPTQSAESDSITVRTLDVLRPEAVGLYPASRVGLPSAIWGDTPATDLTRLIHRLPNDMLPALRELSLRMLLAEFTAPIAEAGGNQSETPGFLQARLDKLIEFGALDQAASLLDTLGSPAPQFVLARFDISLLLGDEDTACLNVMRLSLAQNSQPELRPEDASAVSAAQVFCHARARNWPAAAHALDDAQDWGTLAGYDLELLTLFLDEDHEATHDALDGSSGLLPPPSGTPSPLQWRLREAAGERVATLGLPVAFAHADLRGTIGWRAQLEAAERLVRMGAVSGNRLLGLYTERRAAASGGIWERVRNVQRLDALLLRQTGLDAPEAESVAEVSNALLTAWNSIVAGELEVPMADLYSPHLAQVRFTEAASDLAFRIGLLSRDYETVALALDPATASAEQRFLAAIARGLDPTETGRMSGEVAQAVAIAFGPSQDAQLSDATRSRLDEGRVGEEILRVLIRLGGPADPRQLADGLTVLRRLGLEDVARRTALESLLLDRRG